MALRGIFALYQQIFIFQLLAMVAKIEIGVSLFFARWFY
jgi:hypothetical protein